MEVREPSGRYLVAQAPQSTGTRVSPLGWQERPFRSVVHLYMDFRGRTPKKLGLDWGGGEIVALSANNVQMGRIDFEKEANCGSLELYRRWMTGGDCQRGDVLLTTEAPLGNVAQVPSEDRFILSQRVLLVRPVDGVSKDFLAHQMRGDSFQSELVKHSSGTTALGIQRARLDQVLIALPESIEEQRGVARALTDADTLIDSLEQLLTKQRQIKQGAMQELLTGKRRLPGFSSAWRPTTLGELAQVQRGASPRPIDSPEWFEASSAVGWVRISDVTQADRYLDATTQYLSQAGIRSSRFVPAGSLIMSICATVGRPVITKLDTCIHDGFVVMSDLQVDQAFLYYVLRSLEDGWSKHGQTGSQMNLNTGLINGAPVEVPVDPAEQHAIAQVLTDMDAAVSALQARLAKARELKQALMQVLLTGRIRLLPPQRAEGALL